jgi:hypothetical protein
MRISVPSSLHHQGLPEWATYCTKLEENIHFVTFDAPFDVFTAKIVLKHKLSMLLIISSAC